MKHQTSFGARLALGALLFGLLVGGCRSQTNGKGTAKPPEDEVWLTSSEMNKAQVQLATIEEREVDRSITAGGRIAFDDLRVTHVLSPVVGRVTRVLAQPGERVKKGAPLLAILSPDIGTAVSDVVKAQADLSASERDFHRQQQLAAAHAGTQRELEAAEGAYRRSQAELARARLKQQLLKSGDVDSVTQEFILRSPIEGRIVSRAVNPGMEVQGQYSGGTALELFTIGELDQVWVLADVSDQDFPRVHKGAEVTVKVVAYPDRQFKGTVDWVSSTLDPTLRTAKVRCSLPNPDQALKIDMYATLDIGVQGKKAVAVPREALVRINDQTVIYVAQGQSNEGWSVFKRRRVEVIDDGEQFLAVSGVSSGEQVVIQGAVSAAPANDEAWITPKQLEAASVKLAVAREQDLEMTVSVGGKVAFDDLRVTHVFSPVNGRVMKVFGNLGEKIAKGAPLVTIASPDVGSAFSDLLKAKADLTSAEREYRRQQDLYAAHAGAQKDLEMAEGNYRKARAEHDRAQLKSTLLKSGSIDEVTQQYTLRSRIAGEIIARNVNPGAEVQGQYSGANNPIEMFTIGELDPIWVFADVYEMDLSRIQPGAPVTVRSPLFPEEVFRGKVDWIADALDPVMRTARVRCSLANPKRLLKPEMYQIATISAPVKAMLAVPRSAVLRLGDETVVFVAAGQRPDGKVVFKRRQVVVNEEETGELIPVLNGLKSGDTIVVEGAIFLAGLV
ncbi:MAG TPA: efflux RND transporter periplasmic adaptor subunit [Myxococcaceae bacterium]|nr:efflux RND transporter periplasmic adaptor subunit [Myxococcaceae bacterium]